MIKKLFLIALLLCSCTSTAVQYAELKYPECKINELKSSGNISLLEVDCPQEKPFEIKFRRKK